MQSKNIADIAKYFYYVDSRHIQTDLCNNLPYILQKLPENRYIHFIDSDDYFTQDCIQKCIKSSQNGKHDIIWHRYKNYIHASKTFTKDSNQEKNRLYRDGIDFFSHYKNFYFTWVWKGAFKTDLLNAYNLRFQFQMDYEDCDFGTILFLLAKNSIITKDFIGIIYRIRPHSLSNFYLDNDFPPKMPEHLEKIKKFFKTYKQLKIYAGASYYLRITTTLKNMQNASQSTIEQKKILQRFCFAFLTLCVLAQWGIFFQCKKIDPHNINPIIKAYYKNLSLKEKIRIKMIFIKQNNIIRVALRGLKAFLKNLILHYNSKT
ncbi:glycosyltransferase [Helicobacter anatolicus]|uniref:glycosyltransferase n=1 Tax=Helicobacter anatolicus TaxID=2905874 RepID=UPI001E34D87F|nr:glycosyltransferase [Helicobacter anatolicus]MCE3039707.1 hypothetical protein [Helicobacter anatolicus]